MMTFDGNKFKYLCDTARVTEDKAKEAPHRKDRRYRQQDRARAMLYAFTTKTQWTAIFG